MTCLLFGFIPEWHVAGEHKLFGEHQTGRKLGLSGNE